MMSVPASILDKIPHLPESPGLGVTPNLQAIAPYLVDVEIRVGGKTLYRTPAL